MHLPVMLEETLERLDVRPGGVYVDATLGGGGHSAEILRRAGEGARLLGIDRDEAALARAAKRLAALPGEKVFVHGNHGDLGRIADENGFEAVDGVLIDTGVSSDQLDTAERGFSFRNDGPLDMRMDPSRGETAADLIARLDVAGLAEIFRKYGEEPRAGHVARAVAKARDLAPITTTGQLADIVSSSPAATGPGGRLAVITFESLSDRLVKQCFAAHAGRMVSLQQGGSRWEGALPRLERVDRHAVAPGKAEAASNPRARSAKLRAVRMPPAGEVPEAAKTKMEDF